MGDYLDLLKFFILKNEILVLSFSLQVALIELHLILIIFVGNGSYFSIHGLISTQLPHPLHGDIHHHLPQCLQVLFMHYYFFKGNCLRSNYSTQGGRVCLEQLCKFFYDLLTRNVS